MPKEVAALRAENKELRADNDDLRERLHSMADNLTETLADNAAMAKVLEVDDQLAGAMVGIKRLTGMQRVFDSQLTGLMNEKKTS